MQGEMKAGLQALVGQYESGKTLPQRFYTQPELFDYEAVHVFNDTWFFARHSSEIAKPGDYAVIQIARASIILVRGQDGVVRGFHNVCGHRAAKLCNTSSGSMARITCPYHSWTYGLDGRLLATQFMGDDFRKDEHPLRHVLVAEDTGLIFVNLCPDARPFEDLMAPNREMFRYHGMDKAQVALRRSYVVDANWKLSIENFTECYHCAPSHQTLTRIMSKDRTILVRIDAEDPAAKAASERVRPRIDEMNERLKTLRDAGEHIPEGYREPLAAGVETGTVDGRMLLPPMTPKGLTAGTESVGIFEVHTGYFNLYEDHAIVLSYLPMRHDRTIIEVTWFIRGDIPMPDNETIEKLTEVWDITTREDKWLTENTVEGVSSPFYVPGTLSHAETGPREFLDWYIGRLKGSFDGGKQQPHRWENWAA